MINKIDIVTQSGASSYWVGKIIGNCEVSEIKRAAIKFTGDPFDHYCGYNKKGEMLFSINCLCPCVVEYKI